VEWLNLVKIVENIGLRGGGQITELENYGGQPSERNEGLRATQYTATVFLYYLFAIYVKNDLFFSRFRDIPPDSKKYRCQEATCGLKGKDGIIFLGKMGGGGIAHAHYAQCTSVFLI
jgi:hypothetical protein